MENASLNLARKWRSKTFQEIVGQELATRILQNSLFKNTFFPVYLFSGQRGCGKTSTARVFATAMNCHKIAEFQANPKNTPVPCLACDSCTAMSRMRHPDFVEIDAASYTGVDNIRNIIDTSSFLPVLSKRKVYLIDEVHMLSKAAFNAFLKILEEPPSFVVFILATTEVHKLPETVKSRCFQLFFNPIKLDNVGKQLARICKQEEIAYDQDALELIAQASEGSLRDAINLLEQARFAHDRVSKKVVCAVLGYLDDERICSIALSLMSKNHEALLKQMQGLEGVTVSREYVLNRLQELWYDIILIKYDVPTKYFAKLSEDLMSVIKETDISLITSCFSQLVDISELLSKTSNKQLLFESSLLSITLEKKKIDDSLFEEVNDGVSTRSWSNFLQAIEKVVDPVLYSILTQSSCKNFDVEKKVVQITTLKKFAIFQDVFLEQKKQYQPFLDRFFGQGSVLFVAFEQIEVRHTKQRKKEASVVENVVSKKNQSLQVVSHIDISDVEKWKLTHTLLKHFGGTVREVIKDTHESDA